MKKTVISILSLFATCSFAQVAIGKTSITSPSVSLEFYDDADNARAMILPWVDSQSAVTGAVDGTIIYDTTDNKVKYLKAGSWFDLSITGAADTTLQDALTENASAKSQIGGNPATDTTPGILVLADTDKAMVLPKVASPHLNIVNPSAGMMCYDTVSKTLAVFNGSVWSYWK